MNGEDILNMVSVFFVLGFIMMMVGLVLSIFYNVAFMILFLSGMLFILMSLLIVAMKKDEVEEDMGWK